MIYCLYDSLLDCYRQSINVMEEVIYVDFPVTDKNKQGQKGLQTFRTSTNYSTVVLWTNSLKKNQQLGSQFTPDETLDGT